MEGILESSKMDKNCRGFYRWVVNYIGPIVRCCMRLHVYGAEKASRWFGKILTQFCGAEDRRGDAEISAQWEEICKTYHDRKKAMELKEE